VTSASGTPVAADDDSVDAPAGAERHVAEVHVAAPRGKVGPDDRRASRREREERAARVRESGDLRASVGARVHAAPVVVHEIDQRIRDRSPGFIDATRTDGRSRRQSEFERRGQPVHGFVDQPRRMSRRRRPDAHEAAKFAPRQCRQRELAARVGRRVEFRAADVCFRSTSTRASLPT